MKYRREPCKYRILRWWRNQRAHQVSSTCVVAREWKSCRKMIIYYKTTYLVLIAGNNSLGLEKNPRITRSESKRQCQSMIYEAIRRDDNDRKTISQVVVFGSRGIKKQQRVEINLIMRDGRYPTP